MDVVALGELLIDFTENGIYNSYGRHTSIMFSRRKGRR